MILDIACGSRLFGDIGVDLDKVYASDSPNIPKRNVIASVLHLPFRNNSFEVVHFIGILHHVRNPIQAWDEMVRVASDIVIGEEPSFLNPKAYQDPYHIIKGFRRKQLVRICNRGIKHLRVCWYIPSPVKFSVNFQIIGLKRHDGSV